MPLPIELSLNYPGYILIFALVDSERSDPTQVAALAEAAQQAVGMPKDAWCVATPDRLVCKVRPRERHGPRPQKRFFANFFFDELCWHFETDDFARCSVIADPFWDANLCYGCFFNHVKRTSQFLKFKSYTSCFVWSLT